MLGEVRAYGWTYQRDLIDNEADHIRAMAQWIIDGKSIRSLAAHLNDQGIATVTGTPWSAGTIRLILANPRIVGQRADPDTGSLVDTNWPAAITPDTWTALHTALQNITQGRSPRTVGICAGIIHCGNCGSKMYPAGQGAGKSDVYRCNVTDTSCGRLRISLKLVDADIEEQVLLTLADAKFLGHVHKRIAGLSETRLGEEIAALEGKLTDLGVALGAGTVDVRTVEAATGKIRADITEAEAGRSLAVTFDGLPDNASLGAVAAWWEPLPVLQKRQVVAAFIARIDVAEVGGGRQSAAQTRERLTLTWKK